MIDVRECTDGHLYVAKTGDQPRCPICCLYSRLNDHGLAWRLDHEHVQQIVEKLDADLTLEVEGQATIRRNLDAVTESVRAERDSLKNLLARIGKLESKVEALDEAQDIMTGNIETMRKKMPFFVQKTASKEKAETLVVTSDEIKEHQTVRCWSCGVKDVPVKRGAQVMDDTIYDRMECPGCGAMIGKFEGSKWVVVCRRGFADPK